MLRWARGFWVIVKGVKRVRKSVEGGFASLFLSCLRGDDKDGMWEDCGCESEHSGGGGHICGVVSHLVVVVGGF